MNEEITHQVIQSCIFQGTKEFIICAGSRNSSFVQALRLQDDIKTYYWPEERSAAFFALGRSKLTERPVAVVTTSGTAAAELLPAAMEAFYSGIPLILITADRPPIFRGSGAPQSAEQVGLFGTYVQFCLDISTSEPLRLEKWQQKIPVHLNVCLEEPQAQPKFIGKPFFAGPEGKRKEFRENDVGAQETLNLFLNEVENPLAIVSTLNGTAKEEVVKLLLSLEMPVMLEAISGLREDPRLQHLSIHHTDNVLETAKEAGYPVDGILRIGGVPTHRIWRDLEYLESVIKVCVLSEQPFSGLSWARSIPVSTLENCFNLLPSTAVFRFKIQKARNWLEKEKEFKEQLIELFTEEKEAEPSLMHTLSMLIPQRSHIYLGNSLPIRQWDMAAIRDEREWIINANRGVNGIDGQISTFLGLCQRKWDNWGIFGDLTTLYDMVGMWILPQLTEVPVKIVVINNGGGKIFERMYPYKEMLNEHRLSFRSLAEMWSMNYLNLQELDATSHSIEMAALDDKLLLEIIPDPLATSRFWSKYAKLGQKQNARMT